MTGTTRDLDQNPYSPDEARVAEYFAERGIGGGDDPIGSLMASHSYAIDQRNRIRRALELTRGALRTAIMEMDRELR